MTFTDEHRSGISLEVIHRNEIEEIHNIDGSNRIDFLRSQTLHGLVVSIFHEKLSLENIPARWVPRLIKAENTSVVD